ncbi:UNVERIFIED_CONTAM: hypothetical protein GTU68_020349 [Idotea baltica]|nr:hypothetical protein [Idotea baltica]
MLFGNVRRRVVSLKEECAVDSLRDLLRWLRVESGFLSQKPDLFFSGDTVRPGIIVLINDSDWELCEELDYRLMDGDRIAFISTLHGG